MIDNQRRGYRRYLVIAPIAAGIGFCLTSFAAADYRVCTPTPPLFTSYACTSATSPPSGYVCDATQQCYPRGSPPGQAVLKSQQPPKPGDRKPLAGTKTPATSNFTKNPADKQTSTMKQPNTPPPPGAIKPSIPNPVKPCPTTARC